MKGPISLTMHHVVMMVVMVVMVHDAGAGGSNERHGEQGSENIGE